MSNFWKFPNVNTKIDPFLRLTVYPEQCTQTGSDAGHPFSAACLVILCEFLKSKQSTLWWIDFSIQYARFSASNKQLILLWQQIIAQYVTAMVTLIHQGRHRAWTLEHNIGIGPGGFRGLQIWQHFDPVYPMMRYQSQRAIVQSFHRSIYRFFIRWRAGCYMIN